MWVILLGYNMYYLESMILSNTDSIYYNIALSFADPKQPTKKRQNQRVAMIDVTNPLWPVFEKFLIVRQNPSNHIPFNIR